MAIDHLFADLPAETFSKLKANPTPPYMQEIYTFGSAASHFNNPHLRLPAPSLTSNNTNAQLSPPPSPQTDYIPHIEHYVNELDIVPRWGVLNNMAGLPANRYAGGAFIRLGVTGHLFNQHYLGSMFPFSAATGRSTVEAARGFLEQVVQVDEETAERREREAGVRGEGLRRESWLQGVGEGNREGKEGAGMGMQQKAVVQAGAEVWQAKGKTVMDLSRLWMYLGGAVPES
ncbi:MAG: hypothetical protein Q9187_002131 [Circinaria calcarea]